ncbi:hypothetical protein PNA2_0197 [Pyrococcus sp. NA2]|uniref:hypothetical protein n=1 Tax=Pyrococcus sp. (strain NA2) TaxID=342949 RepID=UPI000209AF46|nr:hypothetical protein [Pyrococcus sp. NA2]AEC51115.1 hypothetical protein PNA2_0197 [Pyrococcus sp. NA2]
MKKIVLAMIFLLGTIYVLSGLLGTLEKVNINFAPNYTLTQTLTQKINLSFQGSQIRANMSRISIQKGVYNITELDNETIKELLDPTKWYIGNTAFSFEYANRTYQEIIEVVENSTNKSMSIIQKFLGVFRDNGIREIIANITEKAKKLLER